MNTIYVHGATIDSGQMDKKVNDCSCRTSLEVSRSWRQVPFAFSYSVVQSVRASVHVLIVLVSRVRLSAKVSYIFR